MADWLRDAVFYQIFPDRFARCERVPKLVSLEAWDAPPGTSGYKGGDLRGVVERLDYLSELGITALYLNPIFTATANHRYHTADYFAVDPMLGGTVAFEGLLTACHDRGMKVVIDGVFNHCGRAFPPFADVAENGAASPYRDWFFVHALPLDPYGAHSPRYASWMNLPALPKFDTGNAEVREFLQRVAEHWVKVGIDGWRLDTPEQIETPGFWQELAARVKAVNADAVLIGEVWDEPSAWLAPQGPFDAVLNYHVGGRILPFVGQESLDRKLTQKLAYPFKGEVNGEQFAAFLEQLYARFPAKVTQSWLSLDACHDTPRRASMLSGDRRRVDLAEMLRFTLPGAPCIYYGEELALEGGMDPGCRAGFPWDSASCETTDWVRRLAALRHGHLALRRGEFRVLAATAKAFAFARTHTDGAVIVALNVGDDTVELPVSPDIQLGTLLLGEGSVAAGRLRLPALRAGVWQASLPP